jgi:tight adherence protein C
MNSFQILWWIAILCLGVTVAFVVASWLRLQRATINDSTHLTGFRKAKATGAIIGLGKIIAAAFLLDPWRQKGFSQRADRALAQSLKRAGLDRTMTSPEFRAFRLGSFAIGVCFGVILVRLVSLARPDLNTGAAAILVALPGIVALLMTQAWIRDKARSRRAAVLRDLPFMLELMTLGIESGQSLSAALVLVIDKAAPGPLLDHLRVVMAQLKAGQTQETALREFGQDVDVASVHAWVAAVLIAHRQGASLAEVFRAQAEQVRIERFLRAEKAAMQAPVKMLLPLVVFIFPSAFIVLFFPVISRLMAEGFIK